MHFLVNRLGLCPYSNISETRYGNLCSSKISFTADSFQKTTQKSEVVCLNPELKEANSLYRKFLSSYTNPKDYTEISSNSKIYCIGEGRNKLAIKVKHDSCGIEDGVVKKISPDFESEVQILAKLPHKFKHRLKLIGYSTVDGQQVNTIATDFITGQLPDARYKNFSESALKSLYSDFLILDESEIYHRDLAVQNIIVDEHNIPRILDYGAAKTFEEMYKLADSGVTKYKYPDFIALNNLQDFELNCLIVYLKQMQTLEGQDAADELFSKHIALKSDYFDKHSQIVRQQNTPNKEERIKSDLIYRDVFALFKNHKLDKETKTDIMNAEKLRIKMEQAQKRVRLYSDNSIKNPLTAIYWNVLEGVYTRALMKDSSRGKEKYKDNKVISDYFDLQQRIAEFHYNEIFTVEYQKHLGQLNQILLSGEDENFDTILKEDNLLATCDSSGKWKGPAISIYTAEINGEKNASYKF